MDRRWEKCSQLLCLLSFISFFISCGSGNNNGSQQALPPQPKYQVYTVEIKDMKFVPDSIVVKKGDEVVFVNRDPVNHCVTELPDSAWGSGPLLPGESYLLVAKQSADYYCALHKVMKGKIIVQ